YMRCLNGGLLVNYHYTRFGEVLLFLSLKPLDTQGLRIMKFIHLTNLINHYIQKEGLNGPIDYSVKLSDEVELYGIIKVFSQDVQLKMTFEPEAQKNGDLLLRQKSILIGNLNLPVEFVLKFIQKSYKFPDWVTIQPNKKTIYVALQSMKVNNEMIVHADRFDLKNDDISFTLQIPTE
ncbi:YpmS family protein, partial [Heyndrickxia sporothermodurans]|uniref:YpmS family protein n=1 Tax=Heyndrickxia sporothermodurans TaxID=46224 RepID=UPI001BC939BD